MDTMDLLNYGWASYLSAIMGLNPATFQLAQGSLGLQTSDSSGLFLMADAVPPAGDVHFYDATSMNKRSSAYLGLLGGLLPETNPNALTTALGAQYPAWVAWKIANPPLPGENYMAWFSRWGTQNGIDPGLLTQASISIMQAQNTPSIQAYNAYTNPAGWQLFFNTAGGSYTLPTYSTTLQAATSAIAGGSSIPSLNFDSGTINASRLGGIGPRSLSE
jgi:hypothetical protein